MGVREDMKIHFSCPAKLAAALILVMGVSGCVVEGVKQAPVLEAKDIAHGEKTKPVAFRKIVLKMPRTKTIGKVGTGLFCVEVAKRRARSGRYRINEELFSDVFREELENHNFTVVGNPDALFEDRSLDKARYFVAGLVKDIEANDCYPFASYGNTTKSSASAYLKVNWQIFETLSKKVVYSVDTEGSAKQEEFVDDAMEVALSDAFAAATQNLLADEEFFALVAGKNEPNQKVFAEKLVLKQMASGLHKAFDPVKVRPGVVTVRTATGHGSGFFISKDGFLLTNHHVVGEASNVRIILHSGRHVPGEVLRSDSIRDIALVKVGEHGMSPMALNFKEPAVGSPVLVYGTPMRESLEGTLTRGIISAYRAEKEKRYIQSDVTIQPGNSGGPMMDDKGNVIAVSVAGYLSPTGGGLSGHNLFIPLREAFESLGIKLPTGPIADAS